MTFVQHSNVQMFIHSYVQMVKRQDSRCGQPGAAIQERIG
jgi:hypothetical protein